MDIRRRLDIAHTLLAKALSRLEEIVMERFDRDEIATHVGLSVRKVERLFAKYLYISICQTRPDFGSIAQ